MIKYIIKGIISKNESGSVLIYENEYTYIIDNNILTLTNNDNLFDYENFRLDKNDIINAFPDIDFDESKLDIDCIIEK